MSRVADVPPFLVYNRTMLGKQNISYVRMRISTVHTQTYVRTHTHVYYNLPLARCLLRCLI